MANDDAALFGTDLFGQPLAPKRGALAEKFTFPPFTVLDAKQGAWQDRKRAWLAYGIQSEIGRGAKVTWGISPDGRDPTDPERGWTDRGKARAAEANPPAEAGAGGMCDQLAPRKPLTFDIAPGPHSNKARGLLSNAVERTGYGGDYDTSKGENAWGGSGTSVFDPVLCELMYKWFTPPGGLVLDPFAGGSVRGIIAAMLGYRYTGIELRAEQVAANRAQAAAICRDVPPPEWVNGDSRMIVEHVHGECADFIFSCPPYGDLERYSDDPADLSTLAYPEFIEAYRTIIAKSLEVLKPNRFACFVVGDFRDARGLYRKFHHHTTQAFEAAGAELYNEGVLVTALGSLPIRTSAQFDKGRKLGKAHQNVLVFVKGDWREAAAACCGTEPAPEPEPAAPKRQRAPAATVSDDDEI